MTEPAAARFDVLDLLARRWRTVVVLVVLGTAAGLAYGFTATKWYEAHLTLIPSQRSQDSAAMALAGKLPFAMDSMSTDVQRIQAVLRSVSVTDDVIEKFQLEKRYQAGYREATRAALWSHCTTAVDRRSGVVSLACEDTDPKHAMEMTAYFGEVGNRVFGRVSASSAREERKFLEAQVAKARADVDEASRKLREFQEKHHLVDLPEQSKATISAMASIQGELLSKQLELSYLSSFSASNEPGVAQLRRQIGIMQAKLNQLEQAGSTTHDGPVATGSNAGSAGSADARFFPGAMNVPQLRFDLEQLMREQKMQETVYFLLTQRYEMARVDEARDTSTFQILDYPTLPEHKSRPRKSKLAIAGLFSGAALAFALILIPAWWKRRNQTA